MPPQLALLIGAFFVFQAFRSDRNRDVGDMGGLFWPSLWYIVVASRPIGYWLALWGVPIPGGGSEAEGSPIDRNFYAGLAAIGLVILARRRFSWGTTLKSHPWLTAFLIYMALSVLWSQYSFISFKRYIKLLASIVMAMVVLTNGRPLDSIFTVIRRCLYIHLPMSIICTRWFRDIGVSYTYSGLGQSWQGISTSKNTLGQIAMLGVLYFFWETRKAWPERRWKNLHLLYLLMGVYLLKGAGDSVSMTSISVCVFSLVIFLRIQSLRHRLRAARVFVWSIFSVVAVLILLIVTHSVVNFNADSFFGFLITKFGRDITLTDRTFIWSGVYDAARGNPILGVGYGGFWIGRMANIAWGSDFTWVLAQAHSGYVDTYLQLGLVGWFFLASVLIATQRQLLDILPDDFDLSCFLCTMLLTIMYVNVTESTFLRGDHHLWFVNMLVFWAAAVHKQRPPVYEEAPVQDSETTLQPT